MADIIMGKPYAFTVGGRVFRIFPPTLGKMFLLERSLGELGVSAESLGSHVDVEALRIAQEKRDGCLSIISAFTLRTQDEILDPDVLGKRRELLGRKLDDGDIASLMIMILSIDKTPSLMRELGIERERGRLASVMRIRDKGASGCSLSFGGSTIFGTLIDAACERYGWTKEYVVWGIDYASLRLMMADRVTTVSLTSDEMKRIPANLRESRRDTVKATRENMESIKSMGWE